MYIQKTKYYCRKCRTHDHWADQACPKDSVTTTNAVAQEVVKASNPALPAVVPEAAAPIKKAREFLKKVGRPKVYPDRKTQMRELMRKKRKEARERAK